MKSEKGQALVETALILPILIMLLFGIVDFGRALHAYLTIDHAGREAARAASIGGTNTDIETKITNNIGGLDPGLLTIVIDPNEKDNRSEGKDVTIKLTYKFSFITPLINFLVNKFDTSINIVDQTVMRIE